MKNILKRVYDSLPLKRVLFLIFKYLYRPSKKTYQHLNFVGDIKINLKDKGISFKMRHYGYQLENEIFWEGIYGGWEKHSLQIWSEISCKSKVIFDIGANTGIYALLAQSVNKEAKVFAFEPVQRVFEKLEKNVQKNGYDIKCIRKAISNYDGIATIYDTESDHTYSVTVNKDTNCTSNNSIPIEVETIRLDTFIQKNGFPKVDLVKIDVERHEVEVIEGFKEYIWKHKPSILIEILDDEIAEKIMLLIGEVDYVYYNIDENAEIKKVSKLTKSDYYNFFICKPEVAVELDILKRL